MQQKSSAAGAAGLAAQSGSTGRAGATGGSAAKGGSPQAGDAGAGLKCPTAPEPNPACPGQEPEAGSACSPDELNCSWGGACGTACRCWHGAWNCGARTCVAGCDYSDPTRCYYGRSPSSCETIDFECSPGTVFFQDECGCGCRRK